MRCAIALCCLLVLASADAFASTVSGRVVDRNTQLPIAGAQIVLYTPGPMGFPMTLASATAGADGRYSIALQYTGSLAGIARAPGYAARTQDGTRCHDAANCFLRSTLLTLPATTSTATADFALGAGARIGGRVTDLTSQLPTGTARVELQLVDAPGTYLTAIPEIHADGSFSADSLHAGSYRITAHAWQDAGRNLRYLDYAWPDLHCDHVQVDCSALVPTPVAVAEGDHVDTLAIRLRRGSLLRTRLVSDGNGQYVIHIGTAHAANGSVSGSSAFDDDGYALVGPLLPGPVKVVLEAEFPESYPTTIYPDLPCSAYPCDLTNAPVVEVPATDGTYTLDDVHVLSLRSIRGRVTSAVDGQPIAGQRVAAGNVYPPSGGFWGFSTLMSTLTGADGTYVLEGIGGDRVMVRTRQNGLGWLDQAWNAIACDGPNLFCEGDTAHTPIEFAQQAHPTGVDFVLGRGASLRGRVVEDVTARPLPGHAVAVVPTDRLRTGKPVFTDADGQFRIDGLTPTGYLLFASAFPVGSYTPGVMYPDIPCVFSITNPAMSTCLPTTQPPLQPGAGGVIDGLVIVVPRPDVIFRDPFDG